MTAANVVTKDSSFDNGVSLRKAENVDDPGAGELSIDSAYVKGDVQTEGNREPISLDVNENTGGPEVTDNRIGNGLQCQVNDPPPTGGGNDARQKHGQCESLQARLRIRAAVEADPRTSLTRR